MLTLVGLQKMQKREFSKESKGKLFFLPYFLHGFFFGVGESQSNLPAVKPPCPEKSLHGSVLVGKDEGDFVSF